MNKTKEESQQKIAELLRDLSESNGAFGIKALINKAKEAADKGKTCIEMPCTKADYDYVQFPLTHDPVRLIDGLRDNGFSLSVESYVSMPLFRRSKTEYMLTISW